MVFMFLAIIPGVLFWVFILWHSSYKDNLNTRILAYAIPVLAGLYVVLNQTYDNNKLQKSPDYINSAKMKNELDKWFSIAQNSNIFCERINFTCDAYLIANDFSTLTNQQVAFISKNKDFNSICTAGFDLNWFYQKFPNYIGANENSSAFNDSVNIILNGPHRLGSRDETMRLFKEQFTENCNLLYKSSAK